jgi:hypothetical protein
MKAKMIYSLNASVIKTYTFVSKTCTDDPSSIALSKSSTPAKYRPRTSFLIAFALFRLNSIPNDLSLSRARAWILWTFLSSTQFAVRMAFVLQKEKAQASVAVEWEVGDACVNQF